MEKSQGLPLTTIVLVIIVIVVLAAVVIFFIVYFGKGTAGVNVFQCQQYCQAEKAIYADSDAWTPAANSNFCKEGCDTIMSCIYTYPDGTTSTKTC